jgi:hypothetical protein
MSGDQRECRRHAWRCAELAVTARTEQLKACLLALSKSWELLAVQFEAIEAISRRDADEPRIGRGRGDALNHEPLSKSQ